MKARSFSRKRLESFACVMGTALLFLGLTAGRLDIGTFNAMGPGFFPLVLSIVLAGLAVAILFERTPDEEDEESAAGNLRPFLAVIASVVLFGLLVPRVGLFPATALAVMLAATGSKGFGWLPIILLGLGAATFCTIVFIYGLSMPIPAVRSPFQ